MRLRRDKCSGSLLRHSQNGFRDPPKSKPKAYLDFYQFKIPVLDHSPWLKYRHYSNILEVFCRGCFVKLLLAPESLTMSKWFARAYKLRKVNLLNNIGSIRVCQPWANSRSKLKQKSFAPKALPYWSRYTEHIENVRIRHPAIVGLPV